MHSKDTNYYYSAPNRGAEYCDEGVMCVCMCLSVCEHICEIFLCMLHMAVARSSSGGIMICYVPTVLWLTTCSLGLGYKRCIGIPVVCQWTHTHGPTFRTPRSGPTRPQWTCWIFMTSCLHNVPLYIATRKWRVLRVTPQVATPGAESAIYDCLVTEQIKISLGVWIRGGPGNSHGSRRRLSYSSESKSVIFHVVAAPWNWVDCLILFWKTHVQFEHLKPVAKTVGLLTGSASSVAVECLFSTMGLILNENNIGLVANAISFIHDNFTFLDMA